jgi:peptidoglycan/LPS O-acetylase OafA/YrhL
MRKHSAVSTHLDLIRGLAALEVFLGHLRQHTLDDYTPALSKPVKLLYFLTGFGRESVMIFFVLSGYFVAGSVLSDMRQGRWSWGRYLVNRGSRLYAVLLPALLLGALWDGLGVHGLGLPESDALGPVAGRLTWSSALGNALFLQEILVKPFGSNGPLWSLSYEAWYYLLFPLIVGGLRPGGALPGRLFQLGLAGLAFWFIGHNLQIYFPLWLLGAGLAALPTAPRRVGGLALGGGGLLCAGLLVAIGTSRIPHGFTADSLLAVGFALALLGLGALETDEPAPALYARSAAWLAGFSYTLYLSHFPPLLFVKFAFLLRTHQPTAPDARGLALAFALGVALLLYAYLISLVTEARTDVLRRWLMSLLPAGSGAQKG